MPLLCWLLAEAEHGPTRTRPVRALFQPRPDFALKSDPQPMFCFNAGRIWLLRSKPQPSPRIHHVGLAY
eukprot:7986094-Lingulodinium_polyedra.AAC.1